MNEHTHTTLVEGCHRCDQIFYDARLSQISDPSPPVEPKCGNCGHEPSHHAMASPHSCFACIQCESYRPPTTAESCPNCPHAKHGEICNEYPNGFRCRCGSATTELAEPEHCPTCGLEMEDPRELEHECPPGFLEPIAPTAPPAETEDAIENAKAFLIQRHGKPANVPFNDDAMEQFYDTADLLAEYAAKRLESEAPRIKREAVEGVITEVELKIQFVDELANRKAFSSILRTIKERMNGKQ